jgi:hypothetical protein
MSLPYISKLLSQISGSKGVARANRYKVLFRTGDAEKLNILCDSVILPGRQILTADVMTDMKSVKRPYAFANEDVVISFTLTNDWYVWNHLKFWQNSTISFIDSVQGNYTVNLKSQYARDIEIQHLDTNDVIMKSITLYNAYPVTLNSIELGDANENAILKCNATFVYDNWAVTESVNSPF